HTNLGNAGKAGNEEGVVSGPMQHLSISDDHRPAMASRAPPRARPKVKGMGNRADQFCIYKNADGQRVPVAAIEYKPPHKVSQGEILRGLRSTIEPKRDVIHQDGEGFAFESRRLAAAVVTQLFSYMVGKSLRYGYICTGEVFVFLHIPEGPGTVRYAISVPNMDVMDDDENRLHRTAVSQVFAFLLQAIVADPAPQCWSDAAADLETWPVEVDNRQLESPPRLPQTKAEKRAEKRAESKAEGRSYTSQEWKGFERSPIRTRASCNPSQPGSGRQAGGDDDDNNDDNRPPSPSPGVISQGGPSGSAVRRVTRASHSSQGGHHKAPSGQNRGEIGRQRIQARPYCTQQCLLGLLHGRPMDLRCPNFKDHGPLHLNQSALICRMRDQLASDRGPDADCAPLHVKGALGALFKLRLSSHGYTFVAKGMQQSHVERLRHEHEVYAQLLPIQGETVPVCLGMTDLVLPYYHDCGAYTHFLFLSWGGVPLSQCINRMTEPDALISKGLHFTNTNH
ncbi:hypothetical protein JX266_014377, partial [Neoarthrinium moseri]